MGVQSKECPSSAFLPCVSVLHAVFGLRVARRRIRERENEREGERESERRAHTEKAM